MFSDAGRKVEHSQNSSLTYLLFGKLGEESVFHTLARLSPKSRHSVKSIEAAEIRAAGEAIDEGKGLFLAFSESFPIQIDLVITVESRDFLNLLSTRRKSIDRFLGSCQRDLLRV